MLFFNLLFFILVRSRWDNGWMLTDYLKPVSSSINSCRISIQSNANNRSLRRYNGLSQMNQWGTGTSVAWHHSQISIMTNPRGNRIHWRIHVRDYCWGSSDFNVSHTHLPWHAHTRTQTYTHRTAGFPSSLSCHLCFHLFGETPAVSEDVI